MATNHHDIAYKELFSYPEFVQQLIEGFAPDDIAALMDFATLKQHNGHYVTPLNQEKIEDVVWSVDVAGNDPAGVSLSPAGVSVPGGLRHAAADHALRGRVP